MIAARVEVGAAPGHGGAAEEAEALPAGQAGDVAERGTGEGVVERVRVLAGADVGAGGDQAEPGVLAQQPYGGGQGSRGPPGVVVAERHVRGVERPDAFVARQGSAVDRQRQEPDGGEVAGDHGARVVGGGVVDHQDRGAFGQVVEVAQGHGEGVGAVSGGDDHPDGRVAHMSSLRWSVPRGGRPGTGRLGAVTSGARRGGHLGAGYWLGDPLGNPQQ
ncbi:hypothetical protein SPAR_33476 [Streptomyces sparsogenes DSM 40356]|uniref:Uncharacterized protein n=1 Tax=Streptomyces sparsogenes DSM 40356 TaxID=1331668 RepID=A0A1R1S9X5_9ACTN|nr:hypothetical protein SPAR_33476 [Streptomyces sparsogenes DSM 40356]